MEVKYNAYLIKSWLIQSISPIGWSTLISRAMPELMEVNPRFSAYYVGKQTKWGSDEIFILRWYLLRMYKMDFPEEVLDEASSVEMKFWDMNSFTFFDGAKKNLGSIRNLFKNILNV